MEKDTEIKFSDVAEKKLSDLKERYAEQLIDIIEKKKSIPGEKIIEITASDLEHSSRYLKFYLPRKGELLKAAFATYAAIGIFLIFGGLLYPIIQEIIHEEPLRASLIGAGVGLLIISIVGYWVLIIKTKRFHSEQNSSEKNT
jgi:uncharacterized membrane protein YraQ (UPF0718 family)